VPSSLASIAANRHTEPARLSKDVRGELDWIVMKALEKDRNRRYETASSFAADIERHLHDEPVQACPPSAAYRFRKFARRNKVGVLSSAAVALALAIGFVVATLGFVHASRQAKIAQTEAARSEQVAEFLTDMLDAAGPSVARGRDTTMLREILDKTAQRVQKDLPHQPEVQGDLWMTLGKTYADVGDYPRAMMSCQHAMENYRLALGNENPKLAMALGRLGKYQGLNGNSSTGKRNAELGLQMARRCGDNQVIVDCLISKADSLDPYIYVDDAAPLYREAIALQKELGDDPPLLADLMLSLAGCIEGPGKREESESLTRQALALQRQHLDPDHPAITDSLFGLAQSALSQQRFEEAETLAREVVALDRKIYPKDHPSLMTGLAFLNSVLTMRNKWQEVELNLNEAVQSSPSNSGYWNQLGEFNAARGNLTVAVDQFSRAVQLTPNEELMSWDLAAALLATDRIEEYRAHCHQFLERSANTQEVGVADVAAKAALLLPVDGTDFDCACKLADFAGTGTEPKWVVPWFELVKALADYRRRRFDSAIDWAERASSSADAVTACNASALCIQACCYAHLKRMDLARKAVTQADQITLQGHDKTREDYYPTWRDWVAVDLLRREAAELMEQQSAPTQPPPSVNKKLPHEDQLPNNSTSTPGPPTTTEP
jgi:tetratricopeptide (TPR) repeat protein